MKKLIVLCVLVVFAGFAIAEIPPLDNPGFEDGMGAWGTWGSGSGSGPSGPYVGQPLPYLKTTGGYSGQNFCNLPNIPVGYFENDPCSHGWSVLYTFETAAAVEGDLVTIGAWAKDALGTGAQLDIRFEWHDALDRIEEQGGDVPLEHYLFDLTTDWAYYEVSTTTPALAFSLHPAWANLDLGKEVGIDDLVLEVVPDPMRNVILFDTTDPGVTKTLDYWGVDQTWVHSGNMTTAINKIGEDLDSVRIIFPATEALSYDPCGVPLLPASMQAIVDDSMGQALRVPDADLTLVLTTPNKSPLISWYIDIDGYINPERWIDGAIATINYVNATYDYSMSDWDFVELYNEPDWEWPAGSKTNLAECMTEYRTRSQLDTVDLIGPSTLSSEQAQSWYDATDTNTDIGATHSLWGSMQSFINFINNVHGDDKPFINPEIHNLIEVMIAAELSDRSGEGGLFWADVHPAEGRFIKACKGKRIGYKMNPSTWSGGCVYRDLDGRIWLFGASSERLAQNSQWEFRCTDREVFFDGVGPASSTTITMGDHEFQCQEITWGDRNPNYFYQYVDNVGNNVRMNVSDGSPSTTSISDANDYAKWEFRPTGAFYYVDNVGAETAAQNCRLGASIDPNVVVLLSNSDTSDFTKWQLTETGDDYYLENIGMQRAGVVCRLKAGSIILTDSSDTSTQAKWSFSDSNRGDINNDKIINYEDLSLFGLQWPDTDFNNCGGADFTGEGDVTIDDLVIMANNWTTDFSLWGHWKLDLDSADSSFYGNDGTVYGNPTWIPNGQVDGALEFDGIDDYVEITNHQGVFGSQSRTVAAWIETTDTTKIVSWGSIGGTGDRWLFRVDTTGALRISAGNGNIIGSIPVNDGSWHHVAAVFENDGTPTVGDVKFYIDGTEDTGTTVSQCSINTVADSNVMIGKWSGIYFTGKIDDVRIYNRALSEAEIQALADMGG